MFRKKKDSEDSGKTRPKNVGGDGDFSAPPLKPFSRKGSHAPAKPPASATFHPDVPRRVPDIPGPAGGRMDRPVGSGDDNKRLVVGRDICLSGEITSCDKLIVEGHVEVTLSNARAIDVAPSGFFKGVADVEEAEISGRYEGELVARDRLIVRAGGRISGAIRYGRIVIESGGEISGDMQTLDLPDTPEDEDDDGDGGGGGGEGSDEKAAKKSSAKK